MPGVASRFSAEEKMQALNDLGSSSVKEVATRLGISQGTLYWWKRQLDETGSLEAKTPGPAPGTKPKKKKGKPSAGSIADSLEHTEIVQVPRGRRGEQISLLPTRSTDSMHAGEEMRRLQRENLKLKRVIASLLND